MRWTCVVTRFHYWILGKNVDLSGSPLGYARWTPPVVACFRGAWCLMEDERLRKYAILGGSATVGTRANNGHEFLTLLQN